MCTFCGRNHNERKPTEKIVRIYDKKDNYLGLISVRVGLKASEYQRGLSEKYPNWDYTTEK